MRAVCSLALLCALGLGCAGPKPVAENAPDLLRANELAVTEQSLTGFTAETRMEVNNANDTPMHLGKASWTLEVDGKEAAQGTADVDENATPGQILTFRVPGSAEVVHSGDELAAWVARGDTPVPLLMHGTVQVTANGKTTDAPFTRTGELRAPRLPVIKMNSATIGRSDEDVTAALYLGVENQNNFEIKVKTIKYQATVNGNDVGSGTATNGDRVGPSQTAEFPIREPVPNYDSSKNEVAYHLGGTVDLGITQVPIDLSGTLTFEGKPPPTKKKRRH